MSALVSRRLGAIIAGKWTLEALLGEGGLGEVYRAKHKNGSRVAIKILRADRARDRRHASRFEREGRLANKVEHPAVVRVLDDGETDDGCPYLVSELVEGETLEEARSERGGKLPLAEVLEAADVLLEVLELAHAKGVLHRDIKPANLMRSSSGAVKVLDFGLATETGTSSEGLTSIDAIVGTMGFMAPEQAQGRWDLVDATTDLWAVGATVLKLVAALDVHEAETPQTQLALAATKPPAPLASRGTDLPPPILSVLDRALAFSKKDRYADAASFRAALQRAARGDGEPASEPPAGPRRRRAIAAGALVIVIVFGALAYAATQRSPAAVSPSTEPPPPHVPSSTAASTAAATAVEPAASAAVPSSRVVRTHPRGLATAVAPTASARRDAPSASSPAASAFDPLDRRR